MSDEFAKALYNAPFHKYSATFLKIEDKDTKLVPFFPNDAQDIVLEEIYRQQAAKRPIRLLILKGRQQGMSTLCQAYLGWRALTRHGTRCITVGQNLAATNDLFNKFEVMFRELDDEVPGLKPKVESREGGRRMRFEPPTRSYLRADSAHEPEKVGRSGTFQCAHLTEVPQWTKPDETMQAVLATIPNTPESAVFIETTAKGVSDWFYKTWIASQAALRRGEEPEFVPVFVPWFKSSEYARPQREGEAPLDEEEQKLRKQYDLSDDQMFWYRDQRIRYRERVAEEYPFTWQEAFLSAGLPFFRRDALEHYRGERREPLRKGFFKTFGKGRSTKVRFKDQGHGPTHIFEKAKAGGRYSVGVDFASGRAADFSAITVVDADTLDVVATHRSKLLPDDVLYESYFLASYYNKALIVPERTGIGQAFVDRLVNDIKYGNVYVDRDTTSVRKKRGTRYGFSTTTASRKPLLEDMAHLVHTKAVSIPCRRLFGEMSTFVYTDDSGDRAEADGDEHDDILFSFAMALAGVDSAPLPPGTKFDPVRDRAMISPNTGY
jgi:hypothetical protein